MRLKPSVFRVCLLALTFLSGCTGAGIPKQAPVERRRPERVPRPFALGTDKRHASEALMEARDGFDAPVTLETAITLALGNDRQIRIARLNVGIAEDRIITARSFFLPKLKVHAGETWLDKQPGAYDPVTKGKFIFGEKVVFRADAKLLVPIYDFGGTAARYRHAKLYSMSEISAAERVRQEVVYEVTEAYFGILKAERLLQVLKESEAMTQAHLKQAKDFLVEGLVDKRDALQAELRLARVRQSLFQAENGYELAVSTFNKMIGRNINASTKVVDILTTRRLGLDLKDCLSLAQSHRPEIAQLRTRRNMAEAALEKAKAARYPRIYGLGELDYDEDEYNLRRETWSAGLHVELDLFSGGKVTAEIKEAEKRRLQAREAHNDLTEGLKLQVKGAYLAVLEASKNLSVTEKAIAQAEENLRISKNQYAENVIVATEVLDAQTLLTNARSDHHRALYYLNAAIARIEWAMGMKLGASSPKNEGIRPAADSANAKEVLSRENSG